MTSGWRAVGPADRGSWSRRRAHAAFHKAAHYFGLEVTVVPVDVASGRAPATGLIEALGADVALVVVSAPSYPHGVIDAVAEVAGAAADRGIPCHVDACVGGWVLPFWEVAGGEPLPQWDFRVRGVSSISADIHKYGYVPKGASLLLFADTELDLARYFAITDWLGYPVVNPTMLGTRSATSLAAAWAVVQTLGTDGYAALTRRVVAATSAVVEAVGGIDGLRVLGERQGPLIAVATDEFVAAERRVDPLLWIAAVTQRGFVLQGQPAMTQSDGTRIPHTAHLTITPVTEGLLGELCPPSSGPPTTSGDKRYRARKRCLTTAYPILLLWRTAPEPEATSTSPPCCPSSRRCHARTRRSCCRPSCNASPHPDESDHVKPPLGYSPRKQMPIASG